eukprot:1221340-Rhodomonas_salina.1
MGGLLSGLQDSQAGNPGETRELVRHTCSCQSEQRNTSTCLSCERMRSKGLLRCFFASFAMSMGMVQCGLSTASDDALIETSDLSSVMYVRFLCSSLPLSCRPVSPSLLLTSSHLFAPLLLPSSPPSHLLPPSYTTASPPLPISSESPPLPTFSPYLC